MLNMRIEYTLADTGRTFHEPISSTEAAFKFLTDCATYGKAKAEIQGYLSSLGKWVGLDELNDHFKKGRKGRLQCAT